MAKVDNHMPADSPMPEQEGIAADPAPEISVLIVSWNARKYLHECLDSLSRSIIRSCEVIVVDNASADGSASMVAADFPWVRLIQSGANLGFAKGNNLGFAHARGRYVCLVNSDVNVFPGCLDALAEYLDRHPWAGMVGPRILNADLSLQNTCREFPSLWNKFCVVVGLSRMNPAFRFFSSEEMLWFDHQHERKVDALVGCFIMARRAAVDDFGLLDDAFFMYGEDIDWCRRCRDAGWGVMFFPGVESIHYGGASSANAPLRFSVENQRAALQVWRKHRSATACLMFRALLLLHGALRATRELVVASLHRRWDPAGRTRFRAQVACLRELLFPASLFSYGAKNPPGS
jgi:GT2 family glycosyltransferase